MRERMADLGFDEPERGVEPLKTVERFFARARELGDAHVPARGARLFLHVLVEELLCVLVPAHDVQRRIVVDDRERTNVLVLAGPGSGKTRVLVHRIAYLVRARRERPAGILALAYNRHAAVEIRRRLKALIGDEANGVVVLTCHALAMRLAGVTFLGRAWDVDESMFSHVLVQAVALLKGEGLPPDVSDIARVSSILRTPQQSSRMLDYYRGLDPESNVNNASTTAQTIDQATTPNLMRFIATFNISW